MVPQNGIIPAIVIFSLIGLIQAQSNVPVYLWNIDSDVELSAMPTISSKQLVSKLSLSLDKQLIAIFLQDELSPEDFTSDDLKEVRKIAKKSEGTVYAPSVSSTDQLSGNLVDSGFQLIEAKTPDDLPSTAVTEKTVLVVYLPATELGADRKESLQRNGHFVREVYEVLKSKQPDVIGIFTGTKNSKLMMDLSRRRITRAASEDFGNNYQNIDDNFLLYLEGSPALNLGVMNNMILTNYPFKLNYEPTIVSNPTNTTVPTITLTNTVDLQYPNPVQINASTAGAAATLNSANIRLVFNTRNGWWSLTDAFLDFDADLSGKKYNVKNLTLNVDDPLFAPFRSSYHCTPNLRVVSFGYVNSTDAPPPGTPDRISFDFNGFQIQPFEIRAKKFGDWYDCQGFFTEGIWAAIFIGLVLAMMLAWATSMVDDIKGPDRFDDPKGKTITVTATD